MVSFRIVLSASSSASVYEPSVSVNSARLLPERGMNTRLMPSPYSASGSSSVVSDGRSGLRYRTMPSQGRSSHDSRVGL